MPSPRMLREPKGSLLSSSALLVMSNCFWQPQGVKGFRLSVCRLPFVNLSLSSPMNIVAPTMASNSLMRELHRKIGHLPPSAIMRLANNGLLGGADLDGLHKDDFKTEEPIKDPNLTAILQ